MLFKSFNYLHGEPTGLSVPLRKNNNMCRTSNPIQQWRKLIKQNLNSIEKKQKLKENLEKFENI